jgi:hypothetical protein
VLGDLVILRADAERAEFMEDPCLGMRIRERFGAAQRDP